MIPNTRVLLLSLRYTVDPQAVSVTKMKTTITKHKRPLLVTLAMWYCGLAIFPFLMIAYTGSTEKSMYVNGVLRNNDYFIKNELIWCIVEALLCAFIFWAIKKEKWWFQPIPLIMW